MPTAFLQIRRQLLAAADTKYREFHQGLCPQADRMIGVRIPLLRRLAREISRADFRTYLAAARAQTQYYEEIMLEGIIIATAPMSLDDRLAYLRDFIPKIDNWAVCDSVAASFKLQPNDQRESSTALSAESALRTSRTPSALGTVPRAALWEFLQPYTRSKEPFAVRFALVVFLDYFLTPDYLPQIFNLLRELNAVEASTPKPDHALVQNQGSAHSQDKSQNPLPPPVNQAYYVMMAEAWLLAEAFVVQRAATLDFLRESYAQEILPKFVQNKAIQKIRESYRVSASDKAMLLTLKRC